MMQTPFTPVVMQQQQQQQKDIQSSLALPTPPTVNQKNLSTPALPSSSSSSSSSTSSPKITLSPNHHNYYTNHLNKAQFNSILINCSINLLKIIYKKNLGDEKSIKMFIIEILRRSKTSIQTLQLACFYLFKIITKTGANEEKQEDNSSYYLDPKKLFLGLIIIASKFNQDYNYSFKSWCKICGLKEESNVKSLQKIEFEILQKLNYELSLINEKYENWCNLLLIFGYDFIKYQIINDDENKNDITIKLE
ncbi:G1/s-specific cyclin, putative [Candida maltosa Xu316]|uniref:G1/s-specific cyclin, putative n=1 Tax=Candida maltosa (strain Xu316) TaxID=1245528 RepID=M3IND4_CANMX|nr:G1/s-specific cyclin, putative [Candida maltosa Xu316]